MNTSPLGTNTLLARTTQRDRALVTGTQALTFAAGLAAGPIIGVGIYARSPLAAFLSGGALLVLAGDGAVAMVGLSFAVGASLGPLFAVALALVRDRLSEQELASGTAGFMTTFNAGCIAGPLASSVAMNGLGPAAVFAPTLALLALLVLHGLATGVGWTAAGAAAAPVDGRDRA
jgi:hypothetical protein